nr:hypothetical protein Q903MT_gene1274 [Picea sitchensis]
MMGQATMINYTQADHLVVAPAPGGTEKTHMIAERNRMATGRERKTASLLSLQSKEEGSLSLQSKLAVNQGIPAWSSCNRQYPSCLGLPASPIYWVTDSERQNCKSFLKCLSA